MRRPSALDTVFLHLEDDHVALHIAATALFEGPAPAREELRRRCARVVATSPHYRQLLRRTALDLRSPRWVDAGELDLDYHLRRTALPAPGTTTQLEQLIGRLMSQPLDPDKPLWEAWVVEGLEDGRWALLVKAHHSLVDGLGGMALFARLLDGGRPVLDGAHSGSTLLRRLLDTAAAPHHTARGLVGSAGGVLRYAASLRPTTASSLTGPLGRARRYRTLTVDLADVRTVRDAFGGTVNDVVLTMVTRAFHTLLTERGETPGPHVVRCLVPVSTRTAAQAHDGANRISTLLLDLPVEHADPTTIHALVRSRMTELKSSGEAGAGAHGFALADLLPAPAVAGAMSLLRRIPQRVVTTVTTNVPGPRRPQTLLGRPMLALYPYVPIAERIRIAVAVSSYVDHLHFGITCDRTAVPDVDVFVAALADALHDLVKDAAAD